MYNYDDDDFLQQIDIEQVAMDVDWLQNIAVQVIGAEAPSVGFNDVGSYDIEVWVEGGRFEKIVYETDVDELFALIKKAYSEFDWEI
jgi:hypothetical protein